MTRRGRMTKDRSKIREDKGSLVIRAAMKEALSFMIKMSETRKEDDSQRPLRPTGIGCWT
jgi:hypothetical protein